jgi:hypothetical protein
MKTKQLVLLFSAFLLTFSLSSCYYDNEEDLYPGGNSCDTSNVTYSNSVAPVFANANGANCNSCHSSSNPSGNIVTDNYASVKANISRIRGAINHQSGYSQMPQNGSKLSTCELTKIDIWINQGMPNN